MSDPLTQSATALAERLLDAGIPIVVCTPNPNYDPADGRSRELYEPTGWNTITVEQARLDFAAYRPGVDTLAMVTGHGIDVLDIDTKVPGVELSDIPSRIDTSYGTTVTPSGGVHLPVVSTGYGSGSLEFAGKHVGDYRGGSKLGGSRGLIYLPGSSRPKYPGKEYVEARPWDIDKLLDSFVDDELVTCLEACHLSTTAKAGEGMASRVEVARFLAEHSEIVDCTYGKNALHGDPLMGTTGILSDTGRIRFGDPTAGLHNWLKPVVPRITELVKAGCLDSGAYDDLEKVIVTLASQHPEKDRYRRQESYDLLAWAIANVGSESGCRVHDPSAAPKATHNVSDPEAEAEFWNARPILAHIRDAAHSRICGKWAVLAVFLARYCAEIRPRVQLPPTVGGNASINLFVVLAGESGGGKSSAVRVVNELADWGTPRATLGSGQGLTHQYGRMVGKPSIWKQDREALFMYADEIASVEAHASQAASTLVPTLCSMGMGEAVAPAYVGADKRVNLPEHGYRLALVVGSQFSKSNALFDHEDAGLPQRFLWAPVDDPSIPEAEDDPGWPGQLLIPRPSVVGSIPATLLPDDDDEAAGAPVPPLGAVVMAIPSHVARLLGDEVRRRRQKKVTTDGTNDHRNLVRLKVAALLALLDGRIEVSDEDWQLAGVVMQHSDATRAEAKAVLAERKVQSNRARGKSQGIAKAAEEEITTTAAVEKAAMAFAVHVRRHGKPDGCVSGCKKLFLDTPRRPLFEEAAEEAVRRQWVTKTLVPHPKNHNKSVARFTPGPVVVK